MNEPTSATTNFLTTYAALRFTSGKQAPGVITPLFKAFCLLLIILVYAPIAFAIWLFRQVQTKRQPAPRPTTHRGYPARFSDHVDDLQEDMK
jgi:hypothetical protein